MKKGYLYILLSTVLFSSMEIALKLVAGRFNPIQITFLRFFIGALILLPLAIKGMKQRKCHLKIDDFLFFALTGFIGVVISMILYQMAIVYARASVVAVLFSCNPIFVVLFAYWMLHEKIYKHTVFSLIISVIGILFVVNPSHLAGKGLGVALTLLSAVTFALYGVIGRKRSERYGGFALTSLSFLFGSAELLVLIGLTHVPALSSFFTNAGLSAFASVSLLQGITLKTLPWLIYIGVFVTGLGYAFYFLAMEATSASTASLVFFIKPVLAPLFALLILHDAISWNMGAGIILIVIGSLISFIPGFRMQKNKALKEDIAEAESELKAEVDEISIKP